LKFPDIAEFLPAASRGRPECGLRMRRILSKRKRDVFG
jgi:predicted RNase H-like nuclease